MRRMKKLVSSLAVTFGVFSLLWVGSAGAAVIVLDFEGLQDLEAVQEFYNGGTGSNGSGPGANFGASFSPDALAIIDADAGGTGNFGGEPSPSTILFFLSNTAVLNFAAGFDTGFSFFYSAINNPGGIDVYDGVDKTGSLLAHLDLPTTPFNGAPDPTGQFSPFFPVGVAFAGTAKSIDFGGTANQIGFDNITFGAATPVGQVPEPSALFLLGAGLVFLVWIVRKRAVLA
jgi:PEP-CTERM motif